MRCCYISQSQVSVSLLLLTTKSTETKMNKHPQPHTSDEAERPARGMMWRTLNRTRASLSQNYAQVFLAFMYVRTLYYKV